MTEHQRPQLEDGQGRVIRHYCSHGSLVSSASTIDSANPDDEDPLPPELDHNAATCLSCTRRSVTGVFPRFRKVSTRLLSTLSRSSQLKPSSGCPVESGLLASTQKQFHARRSDSHVRDPPTKVHFTHPTRPALCFGQCTCSTHGTRAPNCCSNIPLPTIPERLANGCSLLKTTSRSAHFRDFRLDIAQQRITWDSRKKKKLAHIDLERIVEIRTGEQALWAVGNEDSLPHGTQRLFAIVFYQQMALKTVSLVAESDKDFNAWLETLNYLVGSRQPITTKAQYKRWRLITISRQWWESDPSGESATDALRFIESNSTCSVSDGHTMVSANTTLYNADSSMLADEDYDSVPMMSKPVSRSNSRRWISSGIRSPSVLSVESSQQLSPEPSMLPFQRISSGSKVADLVEGVWQEQAQHSTYLLYHELVLSLGSSMLLSPDIRSEAPSQSDEESDSDSDQLLTMNTAASTRRQRMHLDLPKRQPFGMSLPVFARFVRDVQKESDITYSGIETRFNAFAWQDGKVMSPYEFEGYLMSAYNAVDAEVSRPAAAADMDLPLNQYYISTSHNTYLAGDQLVGTSTVEGYIHALLRGCRCLELDCWDGRLGEPVVCHGHTFTTRILFEDVVVAISRYAFAVSPYPVILSLETHCSLVQQARMAQILRKHLGGMLLLAPVNGTYEYELPSPKQLKRKIIIKNKVLDAPTSRPSSLPASQSGKSVHSSPHNVSPRASISQVRRKVAPELSELIVYCKATHFEGFDEGDPEPTFDRVVSVSESTSNQLLKQRAQQYAWYNAVQMTRVYPSFSRFTSTNYNPISHWAAGCQLVALNFQTHDRNMEIYEAMFRRTQGCGYVPKPHSLCEAAAHAPGHSMVPPQLRTAAGELSSPPLSAASSASLMSTVATSSSSPSRRTTVHISVISAYDIVRGPSRRFSSAGPTTHTRRSSFASDLGEQRQGSFANDLPISPVPVSRQPSDVAMFSSEAAHIAAASEKQHAYGNAPITSPGCQVPDTSVLNAAAAVAAAATAVASLTSVQQQEQQRLNSLISDYRLMSAGVEPKGAASRIRVEVEWISTDSNSEQSQSSTEEELIPSSIGQFAPSHLHSRGGTGFNSPAANLPTSFPFTALSSSAISTPHGAPPPPTPVAHSQTVDQSSSKPRYTTKTAMAMGNEVRWRDESLFQIVNDPEISFVRFSLMEDDDELASTCVAVSALREGYRFVELSGCDKTRQCRTINLLLHVQVSQLHCLANMSKP
ncbi:1-phosphatidylinositol 4,5-bisphosphate phosphodiesterase delta-4 [Coemansia sp. RSA 1250]|nr:1-phosphatidylinositol 4,5-bisphosphate phosphodiesterase delta-4 [Coemansia sp. RSA 1250]